MKYRAEIDGLRAVAVVPVILFHAGFGFFDGGFIGVDVFFVISGYLITTIIIDDIERERFTFSNFYARRARRILPALFFVMLICIPFSWMWMVPDQVEDFSESLVAAGFFLSNIFFWKQSGYFETASEEIPLLHTWSLSVEGQYYLIFPILLVLAWRFGKQKVFWLVVFGALISLALSESLWRRSPDANFYLLPTRAWEILAGSIAAFMLRRHSVPASDLLAWLGLALVVFAILVFDESIPFPSIYALLPVGGTLLLILFCTTQTTVGRLLSSKVPVSIGVISYSLYITHYPAISFWTIYPWEKSDAGLYVILICVILSSILLYRFIERPFRKEVSGRMFLILGSLCVLVFIGQSFIYKEFLERPSPFVEYNYPFTHERCNHPDGESLSQNLCFSDQSNPHQVLLWGDSYADSLANPLGKALNGAEVSLDVGIMHSCPSLFYTIENEEARKGKRYIEACSLHNEYFFDLAKSGKYRHVVLNTSYTHNMTARNYAGDPILLPTVDADPSPLKFVPELLSRQVQEIIENGVGVIVVLDYPIVPEYTRQFNRFYLGAAENIYADHDTWKRHTGLVKEALEQLPNQGLLKIVDVSDFYCNNDLQACPVVDGANKNTFDGSHPDLRVARKVAEIVTELVQ